LYYQRKYVFPKSDFSFTLLLTPVTLSGLRLYPPVPLNNRCAIKTTILPSGGGPDGSSPILVRKGEVVIMSQYVMSRKRNIYGADADDFRPERWETGEASNSQPPKKPPINAISGAEYLLPRAQQLMRHCQSSRTRHLLTVESTQLANIGWAYTPFNGGPRTCLGQDFVMMEIAYTIVRLLQTCSVIALPDGEKNEPPGTEKQLLTLVLSSRDGCRVRIKREEKLE
jgi:cytochrome P450